MTRIFKVTVLTLALSAYGAGVSAQQAMAGKLNQYFQVLESNGKFMGSVSVFRDNSEIYSLSVGFADIDSQAAVHKGTAFRIGSISKMFTAVMTFQAMEEGKLPMNETIGKYFPSVPNAGKITISQLLSHRSGIHNFTNDEKYAEWSVQPKTREEMTEIIAKGGSVFEPDSKTEYSNSNYVLLSYILETVYGKPYAAILAEKVTEPLSLSQTYLGGSFIDTGKNECNSYMYFDKWHIEPVTHPSIPLGAGGIVSTPEELNKFVYALFNGRLISPNSLSIMLSVKDAFGKGIFVCPFLSQIGYGHSGGIDGFRSMLIYYPEDKLAYALTSNALNFNINDIHIAVLSWAYDKPFGIPDFEKAPAVDSKELDKYLGVYSSPQLPIKITITKQGSMLMAQGTGQPAFPLEFASEHTFKFVQAGIVMEFNPEQKTMTLRQSGGTYRFTMDN